MERKLDWVIALLHQSAKREVKVSEQLDAMNALLVEITGAVADVSGDIDALLAEHADADTPEAKQAVVDKMAVISANLKAIAVKYPVPDVPPVVEPPVVEPTL
jgi:hypothetical protein